MHRDWNPRSAARPTLARALPCERRLPFRFPEPDGAQVGGDVDQLEAKGLRRLGQARPQPLELRVGSDGNVESPHEEELFDRGHVGGTSPVPVAQHHVEGIDASGEERAGCSNARCGLRRLRLGLQRHRPELRIPLRPDRHEARRVREEERVDRKAEAQSLSARHGEREQAGEPGIAGDAQRAGVPFRELEPVRLDLPRTVLIPDVPHQTHASSPGRRFRDVNGNEFHERCQNCSKASGRQGCRNDAGFDPRGLA